MVMPRFFCTAMCDIGCLLRYGVGMEQFLGMTDLVGAVELQTARDRADC